MLARLTGIGRSQNTAATSQRFVNTAFSSFEQTPAVFCVPSSGALPPPDPTRKASPALALELFFGGGSGDSPEPSKAFPSSQNIFGLLRSSSNLSKALQSSL
eukprot:13507374-Alexandrium_andersonii.AAC.1